jgi:hypothetical protein
VNRTKYNREVANLSRDAARYRSLGVFLLSAEYPTVLVGFAAARLKPAPLIFAMLADYADFDLRAPSVRFVDPFTSVPYKQSELPTQMMRSTRQPTPAGFPFGLGVPHPIGANLSGPGTDATGVTGADAAPPAAGFMLVQQPLLQAYGPDDIPFLCLAGVREYHEHPGHSGDPWELHRCTGAGSLARLVEVVRTYAVEPVAGWNVQLVPQVTLGYGEPPL